MRSKNGRVWALLHEGEFEIRTVTEADLEEALDVLDSSFFLNEAVCNACEINLPQNVQARQELRHLCKLSALDGISLFIRHVPSGRIAAVSFNKLQFTPPAGEEPFFIKFRNEYVHSAQAKGLMDFMIDVDGRIDVCAMYNMDCFVELMFLATLPDYERRGFGRILTKYTTELTRELAEGQGLEDIPEELREKRPAAVTALWSSSFSQKIGSAVGFKVLNTVSFKDFSFNGKRFDERINPVHKVCEHVAYVWK